MTRLSVIYIMLVIHYCIYTTLGVASFPRSPPPPPPQHTHTTLDSTCARGSESLAALRVSNSLSWRHMHHLSYPSPGVQQAAVVVSTNIHVLFIFEWVLKIRCEYGLLLH